MFFEPRLWTKGLSVALNRNAAVEGEGYAKELLETLIRERGTAEGTVKTLRFCESLPSD